MSWGKAKAEATVRGVDGPGVPANLSTDARRENARTIYDLHCHCLPGLDDGPDTMEKAVALCRSLVRDGITTVVATPHQLGRYELHNSGRIIREKVGAVQAVLSAQSVPLKILTGADVRIDERVPALLKSGDVLTLGGPRGPLLLELPHESFIDPVPLIRYLGERGTSVIMSHPERHDYVRRQSSVVRSWVEAGAWAQITCGSFMGDFGPAAETAAWQMVKSLPRGRLFLASDAHGEARPPRMTQAKAALERKLGDAAAHSLCIENPRLAISAAFRT